MCNYFELNSQLYQLLGTYSIAREHNIILPGVARRPTTNNNNMHSGNK